MYIHRDEVIANLCKTGSSDLKGLYKEIEKIFNEVFTEFEVGQHIRLGQMVVTVSCKEESSQTKFWRNGTLLRVPYIRLPESCQKLGLATKLFGFLVKEANKYGIEGILVESVGSPHLEKLLDGLGFAYTDCNFRDKEGFDAHKLELFDMYKKLD